MFSAKTIFKHAIPLVICMTAVMISLTSCWDIRINDQTYPKDTAYFTVTDKSIEDYSVFNQFKNLKTLDLTSVAFTPDEYDHIASQVNDSVEILWNVPVGNVSIPSNTLKLDITSDMMISDGSALRYFNQLKSLNVSTIEVSPLLKEILEAARASHPDVMIACKTSVYGVEFDESTDFLDLNDIAMNDLTDLDTALSLFPNLKTVEICSCTLDNETIAALRDKYPDRKVVWMIKFLKYRVRTDAQVFSTLANDGRRSVTSENVTPLFRYCTELRALDLGHQGLTDISEISNLKKLHTLILHDNRISDISPLAELKELNFTELSANKIRDISPLVDLPNLEDVFIRDNAIKNFALFAKCKKLKRLFYNCTVYPSTVKDIKQALPECELVNIKKAWGKWRETEKNDRIRSAFFKWKTIQEFTSWDNTVYWDRVVYN